MEFFETKKGRLPGKNQPQRERKRTPEQLERHMAEISSRINQEMAERYGVENFLDGEGRIDMQSYSARGSVPPDVLRQDLADIRRSEIEWSGIENENVRDFYRQEHGAKTDDEVLLVKKKERSRSKSNQFEIATTSLFYKFFSDEFVVARASVFDDYRNGVDNVLVNKKTGDVVCAFDEVHRHERSNRYEEKEKKIQKVARKGGADVKYGFQILDGKLVQKEIRNVPVFCLSITPEKLGSLLSLMSFDLSKGPSVFESEIMKSFIEDLERQSGSISGIKAIEKSLAGTQRSFGTMRKILKKHTGGEAGKK